MPTDVIMPQMGESIFEGTLTKWLKKAGDRVEKDEPLFEISTDKVDAEIPSPVAACSERDQGARGRNGRGQYGGRGGHRARRGGCRCGQKSSSGAGWRDARGSFNACG
jgi:hypothetical protein